MCRASDATSYHTRVPSSGRRWKFVRSLRFDLAAARTVVGYDGLAGTAAGAFTGSRWLLSSGLIGTYDAGSLAVDK